MNCVVLQGADGSHLGYMLCHSGPDSDAGTSVFVVVPAQVDRFDTPEAEILFQRREAGESEWHFVRRDPPSIVVRTPGLATVMFIDIDEQGGGQWGVADGEDRQVVGNALLPAKNARSGNR